MTYLALWAKAPGSLLTQLEVVGGAHAGARSSSLKALAATASVGEQVPSPSVSTNQYGIAVRGVADRRVVLRAVARRWRRSSLSRRPIELVVDALGDVAVAVVVDGRPTTSSGSACAPPTSVTPAWQLAQASKLHLRRVRVVAADAGVEAVDVAEADVVDLAGVLVAALARGRRTAWRRPGSSGCSVNLSVALTVSSSARRRGGDRGVDGRARRAALVAGHAARLAAQPVDGHARREGHLTSARRRPGCGRSGSGRPSCVGAGWSTMPAARCRRRRGSR